MAGQRYDGARPPLTGGNGIVSEVYIPTCASEKLGFTPEYRPTTYSRQYIDAIFQIVGGTVLRDVLRKRRVWVVGILIRWTFQNMQLRTYLSGTVHAYWDYTPYLFHVFMSCLNNQ